LKLSTRLKRAIRKAWRSIRALFSAGRAIEPQRGIITKAIAADPVDPIYVGKVDPDAPVLTKGDQATAVWLKIEAHCHHRMAVHRKQNDGDLDEKETASLRGRIKELKYILSLARNTADD